MKNAIGKYYWLIVCVVFVFQFLPVTSQQTVKVATKTINKELKYINQEIVVNGEKSKIHVSGNSSNTIQIEIRLISKNPNTNKAKQDLDIIKHHISEKNNIVYVSNFFESKVHREVSSNLSAIIEIKVPERVKIDITNIYGDVNVENLVKKTRIKNSFGDTKISNVKGIIQLELNYNNLYGNNMNGDLTCNAERSTLDLIDISGDFAFKTKYGKIELETNSKNLKLDIEAARTEVVLGVLDYQYYSFLLNTKFADIITPEELRYQTKNNDGYTANPNTKPIIKISTSYCPIIIKSKQNEH